MHSACVVFKLTQRIIDIGASPPLASVWLLGHVNRLYVVHEVVVEQGKGSECFRAVLPEAREVC